jgi:hypothetical protein
MHSREDHAVGLELQLIELVERRERAEVQGRRADADALQREIDQLQLELAELSDQATYPDSDDAGGDAVEFHDAVPAGSTGPPPAA